MISIEKPRCLPKMVVRFLAMTIGVWLALSGCGTTRLTPMVTHTSPPPATVTQIATTLPGGTPTYPPTEIPSITATLPTATPTLPFALHPLARERQTSGYRLVEYPLIGVDRSDVGNTPYRAFRSSFPAELLPEIFPTLQPSPTPIPSDEIERSRQHWLEETNIALEPFGYRLEKTADLNEWPYTLYDHDKPLKTGINVLDLFVNTSGMNFVMLFTDQENQWMLQKKGFEPLNRSTGDLPVHVLDPLFVKDQLITALFVESAGYKKQGNEFVSCGLEDPDCQPGQKYVVQADSITIYSDIFIGPFVDYSLHGLWNWNDQWVLETDKTILIDGKPARAELGHLFSWNILRGKPVYFYRNEKETGIVYDGSPVSMPYDFIVFEGYCCGSGRYNPRVFDDRVVFFARREGIWYYVELLPEDE